MKNKTLKITPPEGYVIDREKSTIDEIVFKPVKKKLTYEDIVEELFAGKSFYYINQNGYIRKSVHGVGLSDPNNCASSKQAEKILALNMMMNVAKYLNGEWEVGDSFGYNRSYWTLRASNWGLGLNTGSSPTMSGHVYFKNQEAAKEALEILGEDIIKIALSVDY